MKDKHSKEAIIEAGSSLMMEKGYNHTGLKEILADAGVPKGSFYHFFDNKEQFGMEVLSRYVDNFEPLLDKHLGATQLTPIVRLKAFFEEAGEILVKEKECRGGCLVGNLGQELADQNVIFRKKVNRVMNKWEKRFTECLDLAQQNGELPASVSTEELGQFLINSWEGAILRMKVQKSAQPLHSFIDIIFKIVLKN